jgi:flagellar biosynthesis anti-sigma factor FlgM
MRIDGTNVASIEDHRKARTKPVAANPSENNDAVVVSARAQRLTAHAQETADARATRVTEIGSALEAGTYRVDYQKVAEKLVDEELARSGR